MSKKKFLIEENDRGIRIDVFLSRQYSSVSRTKIQHLIEHGFVLQNGSCAKKSGCINLGDTVEIDEDALRRGSEIKLEAQKIDIDILYADQHLMAINKPAGLVVHPGNGRKDSTLVNALLYQGTNLSQGTSALRPGIVHRLDKETSGVMIVAKTDEAHLLLSRLFMTREMKKEYIGFCIGKKPDSCGKIEAPIGRSKQNPTLFCVRPEGKNAITDYVLLAYQNGISIVRFLPSTGRTHQIRIHSNYAGFSIVADNSYCGHRKRADTLPVLERPFAYKIFNCFHRHALHAFKISFIHPFSHEAVQFEAPLPDDFKCGLKEFNVSLS